MAELKGEAKVRFVAGMFARISRRYDLVNTVMTGGMHHRWRHLATRLATDGLVGPALDVATGTGDFIFALARQPGVQSVVGVDLVPEMLALARQKAQRLDLVRQVVFLQADALSLPFPNHAFACAASGFGLRNVADVLTALAEMARVVRPGGRVAVLEIIPFEPNGPFLRLLRLYLHRVVPIVGTILTGDRQAYTYFPQSVDTFPQAGELAHLMEEAGLQRVGYRKVAWGSAAILVGEKP
ncbi:ubiquinone/menaquinone biosynthesis methyltransferase [Chloroflexota bacterium]